MMDRPIPFSAPMVRALLEGRKSQTRRILKPQPPEGARYTGVHFASDEPDSWFFNSPSGPFKVRTRFEIGDRLWVREAWRVSKRWDALPPRDLKPRSMSICFDAGGGIANQDFKGDWRPSDWPAIGERPDWIGRRRAGMHLPRWASRLTLVVTDVRVQRLQDIGEADAVDEGIEPVMQTPSGQFYRNFQNPDCPMMAFGAFRSLWVSINGDDGWEANPWVVAVSFDVHQQNIDQMECAA